MKLFFGDVMTNKREQQYRPTGHVLHVLVEQILQYAHGKGDEVIQQRVEQAWITLNQEPFIPSKPLPVGLIGGPGQGKTAVGREAAKQAAALLGMNFVSGVAVEPTPEDFYYDAITLGGVMSSAPVKGHQIPTKTSIAGEETEIMRSVLPKWVHNTKTAGLSFVVFDDLRNALSSVQTTTYDVLQEETSSDFGNAYYGWTGNLGDDGTPASKSNSAITSRGILMTVRDDAEQFLQRASKKFNDPIGTGLVGEYLEAHPEALNLSPATAAKKQTNFACSRTWENLIHALRPVYGGYLYRLGNQGPDAPYNLERVRFLAEDIIGPEKGESFIGFVSNYLQSAVPIVRQILNDGAISDKVRDQINDKYVDGASIDEFSFANTFSVAIASEASAMYKKSADNDDKESKQRVLAGLSALMYDTLPNREFIQNTSRYFVKQIITKSQDPESVGWLNESGAPVLRDVFMDELVAEIIKQPLAVAYAKNINGDEERLINITFDGIKKGDSVMVDEYQRVQNVTREIRKRKAEIAKEVKVNKNVTPSKAHTPESVIPANEAKQAVPLPVIQTEPAFNLYY